MTSPSPSSSPWQDDEMESSSMDEQVNSRIFTWCEVMQTEVHEGPYPPTSQSDNLLIRLKLIMQAGVFKRETNQVICYFDKEPGILDESKIWINFSSEDKRCRSARDLVYALACMAVEKKDRRDIVEEILEKAEPAIPLPQLAIDVTIRIMCCDLYGSFDDYDDMCLYSYVKKTWAKFKAATTSCASSHMPQSCAVCLEDFGGGVDDKMIARLPCLHYFHADCTAEWVKFRQTCPVCRSQIMPLLCDENEPFSPNPCPTQSA